MEIPVINRISDFEAGISSINDPSSFFSQICTFSGTGKLDEAYSFWKWGALIIAFLASFTTLIHRIKLLILRLRNINESLPSMPILDDYDSESDVSCSSSDEEEEKSDDDEDEEEEDESRSTWRYVDEDFRVTGTGYYLDDSQGQERNFIARRRRSGSFGDLFSWPDLAGLGGSSVVNLWDHLDLGRRGGVAKSPAVVLTAGKSGSDGVEVRAWDPRAGFRVPALLAEWKQPRRLLGKIIGVEHGGVEKIYVRDDVSRELTVGDLRRVNGVLTDLTESDVDTWWDADAVIEPESSVDQSLS